MPDQTEMNGNRVEDESPLESDQEQAKNHPFSSLGRQSSIYSLTLDEFQHTLCESGKNFGSMNMDEFLSSIWNAEENQAINSNQNSNNSNSHLSVTETSAEKGIRKQPSLPRQGSLTIPSPLSRKTVDQVWSEIHNKGQQGRRQQQQQQQNGNNNNGANNDNAQNTESTPRQPTFGEMTLEDFLVKAGIVREAGPTAVSISASQPPQQYGLYQNNNNSAMGQSFVRPPIGTAANGAARGGAGNVVAPYPAVAQGGGAIGEPSGYAGNGKIRDTVYPPPGVCYGGRVMNGVGGYGAAPNMGMTAPVSPVSPDGLGGNDNSANQFGMEIGVLRGRKRIIDGPVEKVVERRQRRMIKNRESAARSRARKQVHFFRLLLPFLPR
ncbi:hypothetical protein L6164_033840 [Bauhinia variegata]|uniref:Uncharacterized protein n=1 Tax=Bauhinia variegata TaxID=167791 RepID=A0ACB9KT47_BAUVA|nr:hypothetical protein L6164_033840 [Bauhinia variegata]